MGLLVIIGLFIRIGWLCILGCRDETLPNLPPFLPKLPGMDWPLPGRPAALPMLPLLKPPWTGLFAFMPLAGRVTILDDIGM